MITEIGAVKVRGGEVLGEFQTLVNPHAAIPPFIAVLTGITNSMVADAPPIESALPAFLEFAQRLRAGGPQRAVRRRLPAALRRAAGPALARLRGARHGQAGPSRDHPRRRPQLQALLAGRGCSTSATTPNHRALVRRPRHRRRAARPDGAARRPRRPHARGAADLLRQGLRRPAPQAPPGRGAPPRPRRLPVPRRARPGALRRHLARPPHPGPHLLHRLRDPLPDGRDGGAGRAGDRDRVRHPARGRGPRAAADRRAQAAVQPPLSRFPEKVHWIKLTDEPWPRLSLVRQGRRDDERRLPRPVPVAQGAPRSAWPRCTRRSRCASAATGSPLPPEPHRRACWPRWAAACPPATAAPTARRYAAMVADLRDTLLHRPTRWSTRSPAGWTTLAAGERFEEAGVHRDRLAAFVRAADPHPAALRADPVPRAGRRATRGRRSLGGPRRAPRPPGRGRRDPGRRRRRTVRRPAPRQRRDGAARARARRRRPPPRRPRRCCAGWSRRRPAGRRRRRVGLPHPRGRRATSPVHDAVNASRQSLVPFDERRSLPLVHQPAR